MTSVITPPPSWGRGWGEGSHRCTRIRRTLAKAHGQSRRSALLASARAWMPPLPQPLPREGGGELRNGPRASLGYAPPHTRWRGAYPTSRGNGTPRITLNHTPIVQGASTNTFIRTQQLKSPRTRTVRYRATAITASVGIRHITQALYDGYTNRMQSSLHELGKTRHGKARHGTATITTHRAASPRRSARGACVRSHPAQGRPQSFVRDFPKAMAFRAIPE
ncbi:MAG: hypothetical protein AW06_002687 [Candidatus Accumulibacter cognatus]|uniref:Uncharacterized protein n=1 Tax=Candidatus Accumulibacter cognatus TaxID=2954383 RepID=A0A080M701_9PROT|nr:MAG: hypothetical protein AW06_002687 [Candidatus Accumulibacter cognatus]